MRRCPCAYGGGGVGALLARELPLAPSVDVLGLTPMDMMGELVRKVMEEEDEAVVLVVLVSVSRGCDALCLTSVCLKEALLASMRVSGTGVVMAVVISAVTTVGVAVGMVGADTSSE